MNVYLINKVKSGIIKNDDLAEGKEREKTTNTRHNKQNNILKYSFKPMHINNHIKYKCQLTQSN